MLFFLRDSSRLCDRSRTRMFSSLFAFLSHTRVCRLSIHAIRWRALDVIYTDVTPSEKCQSFVDADNSNKWWMFFFRKKKKKNYLIHVFMIIPCNYFCEIFILLYNIVYKIAKHRNLHRKNLFFYIYFFQFFFCIIILQNSALYTHCVIYLCKFSSTYVPIFNFTFTYYFSKFILQNGYYIIIDIYQININKLFTTD